MSDVLSLRDAINADVEVSRKGVIEAVNDLSCIKSIDELRYKYAEAVLSLSYLFHKKEKAIGFNECHKDELEMREE